MLEFAIAAVSAIVSEAVSEVVIVTETALVSVMVSAAVSEVAEDLAMAEVSVIVTAAVSVLDRELAIAEVSLIETDAVSLPEIGSLLAPAGSGGMAIALVMRLPAPELSVAPVIVFEPAAPSSHQASV